MNLLLLLSALLSALSGVGASVRSQDRAQAVAEGSLTTTATAHAPRLLAQRPRTALPTLREAALPGEVRALTLVAAEPLFASRRRE
ncbi:hypothetical protein LQ954_06910 [Sphingomonas sp. IC-11]|uniref:hypothetical protein n=1 Tax=Sphingomonas sp. IC-11 TaxID=2898528 RepID=UPI001E3364D5|nr:hypothetical protein [Sphingomonas sp. IC-11]MCD2315876.1 hypothetical protein [Sphingomonas sp. IC-11]